MTVEVLLDDQIFLAQYRGGISRYFTELLGVYDSSTAMGVALRTPFHWVLNEHLIGYAPQRFGVAPLPARIRRRPVVHRLNALRQGPGRSRSAIVHHTYYFPEYLRVPARRRVVTVYDMTPELMPSVVGPSNPHRAKAAFVAECDAVLCISNTTKRDLLRLYGDLDKPVVVTPLGVRPEFFATAPQPAAARGYLLFVGGRFSYKNFDVVLRALARLEDRPLLVCTGGGAFSAEESARIDVLGLGKDVEHRQLSDAELPGCYAAALGLVFPSRYEGFGLPTVEAFAAGCPVVLAGMDCSVEVGGEAAQYFAPDDDAALAAILDRLSHGGAAERQPWVAAGRVRAQDFTWRRTAELTAAVYRSLG